MKRTRNSRRKFVAMNSFWLVRSFFSRHRVCLALFTFLFVFLGSKTNYAQRYSGILKCATADTIKIRPVLLGDLVLDTLFLTNDFSPGETTWTVSASNSKVLKLTDATGSADSGQTWATVIEFNADTLVIGQLYVANISIIPNSDTSGCKAGTELVLEAEVIGPTRNDTTFPLENGPDNVIAIQSNTNSHSGLFYFKNESTVPDTVQSISLTGSNAFSDSVSGTSFILQPRDSFPVTITYLRTSAGSDNGQLLVSMPDEPILFDLSGVRTPDDGIEEQLKASISFSLYPNPSQGEVTIHSVGMARAQITITDVLGRKVQKADITNDWTWDGESSGSQAPAGIYFVEITGVGNDGKVFHQVKSVVLE